MLIKINTLNKPTFSIDFNPENTVLQLKHRIKTEWGQEYAVQQQTLIYAGVILIDDRSIQSYYVNKEMVIVVILKEPEEPTSSNQTESKNEPAKHETINVSEFASKGEAFGEAVKSGMIGDKHDKTVSSFIDMGYDLEMVEQALSASSSNSDETFDEHENSAAIVAYEDVDESQVPSSSNLEDGADILALFFRLPAFHIMHSMIRRNPEILNDVLQQIGESNPALLQLISENQSSFINWLNNDIDNQSLVSASKTNYCVSFVFIFGVIIFIISCAVLPSI